MPHEGSDQDSSSAAETTHRTRSVRRRTAPPKSVDELEEEEEEEEENEAKSFMNGANGSNGISKSNGATKALTNGVPKDSHVVDGWKPGQDPKIDYSGEFEFGGSVGTTILMTLFPLLMWYMWVGATYYDGKFPSREPGQTWPQFASQLVNLVYTGAFPTLEHGYGTGPTSSSRAHATVFSQVSLAMESLCLMRAASNSRTFAMHTLACIPRLLSWLACILPASGLYTLPLTSSDQCCR